MKAWFASLLIRMLASTWRMSIDGQLPHGPCVVAFWHGEMLPIWYAFRALRPVALVSKSSDGALLDRLLTDWKYDVVRGSSSSGGKEALDELTELATTRIVLVTPDGPRGPARECKPGVVVASVRARVPLLAVRATISSSKIFRRSWDRFQLPLPFAHITIHVGHGPRLAPDANREQISAAIDEMTHRLEHLGTVVG